METKRNVNEGKEIELQRLSASSELIATHLVRAGSFNLADAATWQH